jgi:mono/diheme cytochrome c family protein
MKNGVVILLRNWVVILNWNQVLTLNWNWVVNITGICTTEGKALYAKQCSSCHGKKGLGDGSKAPDLKGDFSSATAQKQTDGEIFYKMTEGREDMPSFKKKIPNEEDRWLVVNYVRTLKK